MNRDDLTKLLEEKAKHAANRECDKYDFASSRGMYKGFFNKGANLFLPLLAEAIDMLRCTYVSMASTVGFIQVHSDNCRKCQLIQKIKEM